MTYKCVAKGKIIELEEPLVAALHPDLQPGSCYSKIFNATLGGQ